jgi:hypothetical protein
MAEAEVAASCSTECGANKTRSYAQVRACLHDQILRVLLADFV